MLAPKRLKFRKAQRGRSDLKGKATSGTQISFGQYALKAQSSAEITSRQIEAARKVITHFTKRGGKVWIRMFPHKPLTKKAQEVPMGSGKGAPELFVDTVKAGRILFEMDGVTKQVAYEALKKAGYKLPVKTKVIEY
ncbi:50S ribosomal protein L16 [Candidatus Peregrinibacteria bacterium]|nr:50S ribosomal protein L16 [Candidatus Peregrinibacteria bacterium]